MGRTFASIKDYQVDGNKEMMAIGLMNMAGSCTSSYVITGIYTHSIQPSYFRYNFRDNNIFSIFFNNIFSMYVAGSFSRSEEANGLCLL